MRIFSTILAPTLLVGLSACGGGGGVVAPTEAQFLAVLDADELDVKRISGSGTGIPTTMPAEMPTEGSATYNGVALAAIGVVEVNNVVTEGILLRGKARINADFEADTLSGSINTIIALDAEDPKPVLVTDNIALTNGIIDPFTTDERNAFTMDYSGDLDVEGTRYSLGGTMNGQFRGAGDEAATALSATDPDGRTTNSDLLTTIVIAAEQ